MKSLHITLVFCTLKCILLPSFIKASSFTEPHAHTGVVDPFQPGDPKVVLDKKALNILKTGKPYQVRL
jgi:hypothetical protein